jgi:hypothetical protein
VGEKTGESRNGNLHRKLADVELIHGRQGEEELLSTGEVSWWWEGVLVANGFERRGPVPFYTGTAGAQCTVFVHGGEGWRQLRVGREGRWLRG